MISIMPKRCALGCSYIATVSYHRFPHPERNPDIFKAWVNIVGGRLDSQDDYEVYSKKVVCDIHFTENDKNRNNRLNFFAVPSLHLDGIQRISSLIGILPTLKPSTSKSTQQMETVTDQSEETSTSDKIFHSQPDETSTSQKILNKQQSKIEENQSTVILTETEINAVSAEHNYCQHRKGAMKEKKIKHHQQLVPSLLLNQLKTTRSKIKILQTKLMRLQKKNKSFETRLADAEKMTSDVLLKKVTSKMTTASKIFTKMQYTQTKKKPSGRRFSLDEKVMSLSLYKKSPRSYPLLAKYFTLPSPKSLKRLLSKIQVESGLNRSIFLKMKETVKKLSAEDRLCSLIFDEMSITAQIHYNAAKDQLKGFTHDGKDIADHVLVFMVKGLRKKYKQPVAYYFTNSLSKTQLKDFVRKVINYVQSTGLNILCTVCDQSTVNVSVINELIEDTRIKYLKEGKQWKHDVIELGKTKMIPLFDVPHLLKGVRNNLLSKDLYYFDFEDNCKKIVKWEYFKQVYEGDKTYGELKLLQKLTDEHIYADKIKKMKVKTAAQVFSHSVAVATEHLSGRGDIPEECRNIIKFTKLMDNLFDSLNSSSFHVPNGKIYKGCVRRASPHHDLWKNAIKVLKTVTFIKKIKKDGKIRIIETKAIPSIKNFIRTIQGMQNLWTSLSQIYSFDSMLTRNFNQDPLENFFGNIRSYGARNTAPDTVAFEGAYKSLLINNFNSPHSLYANCENDDNNCLQSLHFFITDSTQPDTSCEVTLIQQVPQTEDEIVIPFINLSDEVADAGQGNYVCGWILGKCLKNISKGCINCKKNMYGDPTNKSNEYIRAKEYKKGKTSLLYPSTVMEKYFIQLQNIVTEVLKKDVPKKQLKEKIKMFTNIFVDYPLNCEIHKNTLKNYFENTLINVLVYSWCRSINRILSGKATYHGEDETKLIAQNYRNRHNKGPNK